MSIKITLLWGAILALCTAAVVKKTKEPIAVGGCVSETELWPSEDGTKFYFCIGNNQALEQSCEPNTFFVKNETVSGCIPFDEVSGNCISHLEAGPCQGINLQQPQTHKDPTKFYFCNEANAPLVELSCDDGKAFAKQNGYMGCFEWKKWRQICNCYNK